MLNNTTIHRTGDGDSTSRHKWREQLCDLVVDGGKRDEKRLLNPLSRRPSSSRQKGLKYTSTTDKMSHKSQITFAKYLT